MIRSKGEGGERVREKHTEEDEEGEKEEKEAEDGDTSDREAGGKEERMIEGKRMIRGKRAEGETGRNEGRGRI